MGRGNRNRGGGGRGRGRGRGGGGPRRDTRDERLPYDKIEKVNEKLESYYNTILKFSVEERAEFWAALRRELPNSFRFAGSKGHALAVKDQLETRYIPEITKIEHYDGSNVEAPMPVSWYPDNLAWWMTTPKNVVRRFPPFAAFQKYLVSETSVGNISRQEVVSMIPPLMMDIEPGMTVLDMCAAPGSKAAQLLEMVHRDEESRVRRSLKDYAKIDGRQTSPDLPVKSDADLDLDSGDYGRTTGLLIANDGDYKRSHMLIHQLKRFSSPNLIVTNHDATMFPSIKLPSTAEQPSMNRYLKFDRILADVPCSGDGTCRKNPGLWKDWNPSSALGLHVTQVRILVRALQMLKPGGRVVYSTCSMNPVENEAVIASAIDRCGGTEKVQLLDCSERLPLLKRKPGLKDWAVIDKTGRIWSSWSEVEDHVEEHELDTAPGRLASGMFAPIDSNIPFERCMRIYAHQQDTGGFFVAVLQKKSEIRTKPESQGIKAEQKPVISAIIDEIESRPAPSNGGSVVPKIESADRLSQPHANGSTAELTPVARQNQIEGLDNGATGTKRGNDDEIDAVERVKKLKTKDDISETGPPRTDEQHVHLPLPPAMQVVNDVRQNDTPTESSRPQRNKHGQQFEEPFKYISGTHPEVQTIETFYSLSPRFPRDRFMVRNAMADPVKTIYYTSALIRDILVENEGKGIKFIHGGVRMFMKQDVQAPDVCRWRIQSEGMPILEGYVGDERVVRLYKKATLRKLLVEMFPKVSDNGWEALGEIGERVRDIGMGCCVLRIEPSKDGDEDGFTKRMALPLWRSLHSLNLMLAKEDRSAMLLRIFNDTTPLVNNQNSTPRAERQSGATDAAVTEITSEVVGEATDDIIGEEAGQSSEIPNESTENVDT